MNGFMGRLVAWLAICGVSSRPADGLSVGRAGLFKGSLRGVAACRKVDTMYASRGMDFGFA